MAEERRLAGAGTHAGVRRGAVTAFVERHLMLWESVFALLALAYLGFGLLVDQGRDVTFSAVAVAVLAVVFVAEFTVRFADAPRRSVYLREHWVDLVSSIPTVGGLRAIRLLRLLRALAVVRVFRAAAHDADRRARERHHFWYLVPCLFMLWLVIASLYYSFEHGINAHVTNFGDALYWTFVTATTVGYGDITPITAEGRVLAGLVVFVGIGLVGFASARFTAYMLRQHDPEVEKLHGRIGGLETQMDELHTLMRGLHVHLGTEHARAWSEHGAAAADVPAAAQPVPPRR